MQTYRWSEKPSPVCSTVHIREQLKPNQFFNQYKFGITLNRSIYLESVHTRTCLDRLNSRPVIACVTLALFIHIHSISKHAA